MEQTSSALLRPLPRSRNELSGGLFAECMAFLPVEATGQRADQHMIHFPEIVSSFGARSFGSYWS